MTTQTKNKDKRMGTYRLMTRLINDRYRRLFILSAIESYAKQVLEDESDWSRSLINKDLWDVLANDCLRAIEQNNSK